MTTFKLEIVTPQAIVFSEQVEMVTLPAADGEIGVYAEHAPLITQLVPGELAVTQQGQQRLLAVGEGLVEVSGTHVAIITDMAIPAENIDEAKIEEARARAARRLEEKISDEEVASVNASLVRALVQLQVKRRGRR